jgi:class 3 adenylate cyclase
VVRVRDAGAVAAMPSGTVTFLFTDTESSTTLWDQAPRAMEEAVARHDSIVRSSIGGHHGCVFSYAGDGVAAAFARADDALGAAIEIQEMLASVVWPTSEALRVRMGLNTARRSSAPGTYLGGAVNRAARVVSLAVGGYVLVSLATRQVLRDRTAEGVSLVDCGTYRLRGVAEPERVYAVAAPGVVAARPQRTLALRRRSPRYLTSFVGRDGDIPRVETALESERLVILLGVGGVVRSRQIIDSRDSASAPDRRVCALGE